MPSACSVACNLLYCLGSLQVAKVSVLVLGALITGMEQPCPKIPPVFRYQDTRARESMVMEGQWKSAGDTAGEVTKHI